MAIERGGSRAPWTDREPLSRPGASAHGAKSGELRRSEPGHESVEVDGWIAWQVKEIAAKYGITYQRAIQLFSEAMAKEAHAAR